MSKRCNEEMLSSSTMNTDAPHQSHRWLQSSVGSLWPIEGWVPDSLYFTLVCRNTSPDLGLGWGSGEVYGESGEVFRRIRFTRGNMVWNPFLQITCSIHPGLHVTLISTPSSLFHQYWRLQVLFFRRSVNWNSLTDEVRLKLKPSLPSFWSSLPSTSSHGTPAVTGVCPWLDNIRRVSWKQH